MPESCAEGRAACEKSLVQQCGATDKGTAKYTCEEDENGKVTSSHCDVSCAEPEKDTDGDGIPDSEDDDDDGDGIPDDEDPDSDGDGKDDHSDDPGDKDTDGDGIPDSEDDDDDGDGIPDDEDPDRDGDGIPDDEDPDDDGDGNEDPDDDPPPDPSGRTCDEIHADCATECPDGNSFCTSDPETGLAQWYNCDCTSEDEGNAEIVKWLQSIKNNTDTLVNNTGTANQWLESIKHDTDISIDQDKARNNELENVAENTRRGVDLTGKNNELSAEGNALLQELVDKESSSDNSAIVDSISNISNGTYTSPGDSTAYTSETVYSYDSTGSTVGTEFGERFSSFVDEMKATSFFSIPDQLVSGIPSGGSPIYTIDGGETYGHQQIDFSGWGSGLAVMRSVMYILFSFISFRIVTLKR